MSLTDTLASRLLAVDAVENVEVFASGVSRFALVGHAFAEQVERRGDALGVQRPHRDERVLERLAGDESLGEPLGQPVVADEAEYPWLIREVEQR